MGVFSNYFENEMKPQGLLGNPWTFWNIWESLGISRSLAESESTQDFSSPDLFCAIRFKHDTKDDDDEKED